MVLTIGSHSLTTGTSVRITANSLTFTCGMDNHATQHTYPRSGDPAYNTAINIDAVGADTITVNVGAAGTALTIVLTLSLRKILYSISLKQVLIMLVQSIVQMLVCLLV